MKKKMIAKTISVFVMLILLCAGCVPAQSRTAAEVKFPLAVRDCAPKQSRNYCNTRYYLTADHVLYGWGANYAYLLGLSLPEQYTSDQPVKLTDGVMDVEGCGATTFILKSDKTLWVIGNYPNPETGGNYCERFMQIAENVAEIQNCNHNMFCCYVLKDTGDLYIIGSMNGSNLCENPEMRLVDSGVTRLNYYFYESEGDGLVYEIINTTMVTNYYFAYYKQNNIWYLSEDGTGNRNTEMKHENVRKAAPYPSYFIDGENNFCVEGYYSTGGEEDQLKVEIKPTNGKKIIARDVAECFDGAGRAYGYLTKDGDLYYTGTGLKDIDTGKIVGYGTVKAAGNVKHVYQFKINEYQTTLYFLKEDDSLWAIGDNSWVAGDGSAPTSIYKENRSVYSETDVTVTDVLKEPVKILDNVAEFTSNYYVKIAVTKDGKRYVWGQHVVAAVATAFGYAANETDPEAYITSKRGTAVDCNQWLDERQTYMRKDIYLVPTLWEDVFGQPFPGD